MPPNVSNILSMLGQLKLPRRMAPQQLVPQGLFENIERTPDTNQLGTISTPPDVSGLPRLDTPADPRRLPRLDTPADPSRLPRLDTPADPHNLPTISTPPDTHSLGILASDPLEQEARKYGTAEDFIRSQIKPRSEKRKIIADWKKETGYKEVDSSFDRGDSIHSPADPESGSPLYNLSEKETYPDDVYSSKALQYYGTGEDRLDSQALSIIYDAEGNPNKQVTVYRAVEKGDKRKIIPGDWITTVKGYAKLHGEGTLKGEYKIVSKTVTAKDLYTSGDSWLEYGYHPQPEIPRRTYQVDRPKLTNIYNKAKGQ